jgi:hypothetical protein
MEATDIFDKRKWFNNLDYTWKRILKQSIDINSAPTDDQLNDILNLVDIDCSNSAIISVEPLFYLKKLEKFSCKKTKIKTLEKLENCTRLQFLDISYTEIKNLDFLRSLNNLKQLNISHTNIDSLNGIANCEALEYLYINNTFIDNLSPLKYCKLLYSVELNNTQVRDLSPLNTLGVKFMQYSDTPAMEHELDEKLINYSKSQETLKSHTFEYTPKTDTILESDTYSEKPIQQTININPAIQPKSNQNNLVNDSSKDYTSYYAIFGGLAVLLILMIVNFRDFNSNSIQEKTINVNYDYGHINSGNGLNLREEPNSNSNIILTIPNNTEIKIISKDGAAETVNGVTKNWYKIEYKNKEGWAWGGYISTNLE